MYYLLAAATILTIFYYPYVHAVESHHQFHWASLSDPTTARLDWKTDWNVSTSAVQVFVSPSSGPVTFQGEYQGWVEEHESSFTHTPTIVRCWSALITNLTIGSTITYRVNNSSSATTQEYHVTDPKSRIWAVFGDLGSESQQGPSGISLPALTTAANRQQVTGVFHVGDLAYELTGRNGRDYMNEIERLSATMPLMVAVGNHELRTAGAPYYTMRNYHRRFAGITLGAGADSNTNSNEYYSFNDGYIHFIVLNTEVYGNEVNVVENSDGIWSEDENARATLANTQAAWMKSDLLLVNRTNTPFVVVIGHRPPFKPPKILRESKGFLQHIVSLMSDFNVDLYMCGHVHAYLRLAESFIDSYRIPPIVLSGAAGSNNELDKKPPKMDDLFDPKVFISEYGYGYLSASAKELKWRWGQTAVRRNASHSAMLLRRSESSSDKVDEVHSRVIATEWQERDALVIKASARYTEETRTTTTILPPRVMMLMGLGLVIAGVISIAHRNYAARYRRSGYEAIM